MDERLLRLYNLAENEGICINDVNLCKKLGLALKLDGNYYIGLSKRINSNIVYKEVLAEELGHCCTGALYLLNTPIALLKSNVKKAERMALNWSILHLVSANELQNSIKSNLGDLWQVADELDLSYEKVLYAIEYYLTRNQLQLCIDSENYSC